MSYFCRVPAQVQRPWPAHLLAMSVPLQLSLLLTASTLLTFGAAFSLSACNSAVQTKASQTPTILNNRSIFFTTPANLSNLVLTPDGCNELCGGTANAIDSDCGPRLFQWVLPVVILIGSIQTPPLAWWKRFWCMLRFIGDPMDALLSIIYTLGMYRQCYHHAGELATTLAERLTGSGQEPGENLVRERINVPHLRRRFAFTMSAFMALNLSTTVETVRDYMKEAITTPGAIDFKTLLVNTAGKIAENRTREMWKAGNAVFWCVAGLVVALVPAAGGSPSGAMLASALALSPLFLFVLLSNSLGENKSDYALHKTIREFLEGCSGAGVERFKTLQQQLANSMYLDRLLYTAGTSCYQPGKFLMLEEYARNLMGWNGIFLVTLLLIFPLSLAAAAGAIAAPPAYFNDRDFLVIGIFVIWVLSIFTTALLSRYCRNEELRWRLVAAKDTLIATTISACLAGTTCGWLSSCRMWAGIYRYGEANARIYLNPTADFHWNNYVLYPILLGVCFAVNILPYFGVWCIYWQAFQVVTWSDEEVLDALRNGEQADGDQVMAVPGGIEPRGAMSVLTRSTTI